MSKIYSLIHEIPPKEALVKIRKMFEEYHAVAHQVTMNAEIDPNVTPKVRHHRDLIADYEAFYTWLHVLGEKLEMTEEELLGM